MSIFDYLFFGWPFINIENYDDDDNGDDNDFDNDIMMPGV
jgi:hypothetical protein